MRLQTMLAVTSIAVLIVLPDVVAAGIKCWTNKDGVRECGNSVPPEYAQQGHSELNKQGVVVKEQERAKTAEELAAEREERERVASEEGERKRLAREQAARDRVLLDTFTTEDDLLLARNGKLQAIDARVQHTNRVVEKLRSELAALRKQAANEELSGNVVPQKVREEISRVERQISENLGFIELRRIEEGEITAQFEADLVRYRELKAKSQ